MLFFRLPEANFGCPNGRFPKSRQDATSRCFNMAALYLSAGIASTLPAGSQNPKYSID